MAILRPVTADPPHFSCVVTKFISLQRDYGRLITQGFDSLAALSASKVESESPSLRYLSPS